MTPRKLFATWKGSAVGSGLEDRYIYVPPHFLDWGGAMVCLCPPPPLLTPHIYFPLELYVYITDNYMAFFIYQLIILWIISINWHRCVLLNYHISKYNSFILVLYRMYINYVSVCPPPPHFLASSYATDIYIYIYIYITIIRLKLCAQICPPN